MKSLSSALAVAVASVLLCGVAIADTVVTYDGFADIVGLTLSGSAAVVATGDGQVLRLCPAVGNRAGSAFSSVPLNAAGFSTFFKFRITDPGGTLFDGNDKVGADGIVFVAQSVSASIGGIGVGIGYAGIPNSVGVEFDTWHNSSENDPDSNHLGIDINGSVNHGPGSLNTQPMSPDFDDGNLWYAWVDYNGIQVEVRANQTGIRPLLPDLSRALDITSILGQTTAYVGFTSGTGADWGNHDIVYWTYRDYYNPVPEPGSLAALAVGLGGFGMAFARSARRRRQA